MKGYVYHRFGSPDVLELEEIEKPTVPADGVLVRVRAASLNPVDWYPMMGRPYVARPTFGIRRPKDGRVGTDFAGTVESVGDAVTRFKPGDEVFGGKNGALAEYVCVSEDRSIASKPRNLSFAEAACVPVAGSTAMDALREHGRVQAGQSVLINGASGGVGTFAVQIATAMGAHVTGVCSTRNVELVRSLGAEAVIDYTKEDFTRGDARYDLMLDIAGGHSWTDCRRVLRSDSTFVCVGAHTSNRLLGPLSHVLTIRLASIRARQRVVAFFLAQVSQANLLALKELIDDGKVKPAIDRCFPASQVREAMAYLGTGHARAKVVVDFA